MVRSVASFVRASSQHKLPQTGVREIAVSPKKLRGKRVGKSRSPNWSFLSSTTQAAMWTVSISRWAHWSAVRAMCSRGFLDTVVRVDRRQALKLVGALISIACVAWIVERFYGQGALERTLDGDHGQLALTASFGALLYGGVVAMMALAWQQVQCAACAHALPLWPLVRVYCVTQFAKYLPGNVGHYVGRHVWTRRYGIAHSALLAAGIGESAVLVFAAVVWSAPLLNAEVTHQGFGAYWVWAAQAGVLVIAWLTLRRLPVTSEGIALPRRMWGAIVTRMLPLHLLFFASLGALLYGPAMVLGAPVDVLKILPAAAAISWLAGFLVVGAPGGIGVREVVFVGVLAGRMPEADLLALAAVMRVITFGGDLIAFAAAGILGRRDEPEAAQ